VGTRDVLKLTRAAACPDCTDASRRVRLRNLAGAASQHRSIAAAHLFLAGAASQHRSIAASRQRTSSAAAVSTRSSALEGHGKSSVLRGTPNRKPKRSESVLPQNRGRAHGSRGGGFMAASGGGARAGAQTCDGPASYRDGPASEK
jgi:hypothetical protein